MSASQQHQTSHRPQPQQGEPPGACRLVVSKRGKNQCESEQAPGYDMCPHHIAAAARDYNEIVAEASRAYAAAVARALGEEAGE